MTLLTLGLLIGGLFLLVVGGDLLVRGASKIASALGVSALVIGLTIVAFGTSAPELVVSLKASFDGRASLAVANVVGSNNFNVLFILGICAIISPLVVSSQLVRLDVPIMIGASILLVLFSQNGVISNLEGGILFAGLISYTWFLIYQSRKKTLRERESEVVEFVPLNAKVIFLNIFFIIAGLGCLVLGGDWFVTGATNIAVAAGVSDTVIGLTIVAIGTSLPEVATSLIATYKGERDIAIGNVVGSNIFNVLLILGVSSIVTPSGLQVSSELLIFDIPLMIGTALACLPIFFVGFQIRRWEGALFFTVYILYTIFLILNTTNHAAFDTYQKGLLYIVGPILVFTLIVILYQAIRQLRGAPQKS